MFGDVAAWGFGIWRFLRCFLVLLRGMLKSFAASRPWFVKPDCGVRNLLTVDGAWYVPSRSVDRVCWRRICGGEQK